MQIINSDQLYIGVGNTVTVKAEGGELTGIVSRRDVQVEGAGRSVEITVRWGDDARTFLFAPYTSIVAINGEAVRIR